VLSVTLCCIRTGPVGQLGRGAFVVDGAAVVVSVLTAVVVPEELDGRDEVGLSDLDRLVDAVDAETVDAELAAESVDCDGPEEP